MRPATRGLLVLGLVVALVALDALVWWWDESTHGPLSAAVRALVDGLLFATGGYLIGRLRSSGDGHG